jgi:ABC-type dipeptide transport system, periplasmic component
MTLAVLSRRGLIKASLILAASTALSTPRLSAQEKTRLVVAADSEPKNLNPAIVASNGVFFLSSKVIEPLAEASFDGESGLAPRLALSWEGADDGLSITFKLREGVVWHDGRPFTSEDVAFSALEVWKPLQNLGRSVFANLEAVDTPDEHTAIFKFSKPTPIQLIRNALPAVTAVLPKHCLRRHRPQGGADHRQADRHRSFKFTEYKPGEYYLLSKNDAYWQKDAPEVDEIVFRVLPDRAGAGAALEAEEVPPRRLLGGAAGRPRPHLQGAGHQGDSKGYEALTYQLSRRDQPPPQGTCRSQGAQAIAHAIDRTSWSRPSS